MTMGLPNDFPMDAAPMLPAVTAALRVWDQLSLEIGQAAVITPGTWSPLLATVAEWYGAHALIVGGIADDSATVSAVDSEAVSKLTRRLSAYPAVCAVELSGRADMVDLLLESVPRYSHVLFAGPRGDRFTIDYYVNVHRKGLFLASTVFDPTTKLEETADSGLVLRAARLLMKTDRATACRRAMAGVTGA